MNMLLEFDPGVIVKFVVQSLAIAIGMGLALFIVQRRAKKKAQQAEQGPEQEKK